jgi:hypothetical protein
LLKGLFGKSGEGAEIWEPLITEIAWSELPLSYSIIRKNALYFLHKIVDISGFVVFTSEL